MFYRLVQIMRAPGETPTAENSNEKKEVPLKGIKSSFKSLEKMIETHKNRTTEVSADVLHRIKNGDFPEAVKSDGTSKFDESNAVFGLRYMQFQKLIDSKTDIYTDTSHIEKLNEVDKVKFQEVLNVLITDPTSFDKGDIQVKYTELQHILITNINNLTDAYKIHIGAQAGIGKVGVGIVGEGKVGTGNVGTGSHEQMMEGPDAGKTLDTIMKERLHKSKLMGYKSPYECVGCADFVSYAIGIKNHKELLKDPNRNLAYVPDLVKEFRAQNYQEITDPQKIHDMIKNGLPVGGIAILANSYTYEDEDHILVSVLDDSTGKTVILNNQGDGYIAVRNDLDTLSDPERIKPIQDKLKVAGYAGNKYEPVITKIFLPAKTETA